MVETAINLYSVRELDEPLSRVLDRVADAGYDGVQFSGGLGDADPGAVAAKLRETGLEPAPVHVGVDDLEGDLEAVRERYAGTLGCGGAVVPYLGKDRFESVDAVERTADRLSAIAADAGDWPIHYHNHAHEFVDRGDGTAFELLLERTDDVRIELDVGWALVGGEDPAELIERHGHRIDALHVKDMAAGAEPEFREIGEGDVDVRACVAAARDADVDWLIYEHDEPADPAASIDAGAAYLDAL